MAHAPAERKTEAAAEIVAPVVMTSSIRIIEGLSRKSLTAVKAPTELRARSRTGILAWAGLFFAVFRTEVTALNPSALAVRLAISST